MAVPAKDGAWVSTTKVSRIECTECGVVEITRWPCNDWEEEHLVTKHLQEKHGGRWRG